MCGVPYLAVLQGAVFYPPILIFSIVSPEQAYSIYLMAHIVLGGFFIVLLSRHLKLSWLASWATAITFMFCANTISNLDGPASLANSIYLPLMILFVLKIFQTGKVRWAVALSLAVVLPLFAGWIQALVYSLYALFAFVCAVIIRGFVKKPPETPYIKRGLLLLIFSAVLFLLLSAIQTFPVIELGMRATRSFKGLSEAMITINHTAMYSLYRLAYDTCNSAGGFLPFYLYMGMLPLLLAVAALWHKRLRFYVLFLYGISASALILSLGTQTPLFKLFLHLPMTAMFRAPFRFLFLHAIAVSLLCGIGLDRFIEWFQSFKVHNRKALVARSLSVAGVAILFCYVWPGPNINGSAFMRIVLAASQWRMYLLIISLTAFLLAMMPRSKLFDYYFLAVGCIFVITLDLFSMKYSAYYLPEKNSRVYEKHARAVEKIASLTREDNSRAFIVADLLDYTYSAKLGQVKKISLISDYENMNPLIFNRYCNYMFGRNDEKSAEFFWGWFNLDDKLVHPELLNYMSAKYIWFSRRYLQQNKEPVLENYRLITASCTPIYEDKDNLIFLNPKALPRAYVVEKSRIVPDENEALRLMTDEEFSPDEEVILSAVPEGQQGMNSSPATRKSSLVISRIEPEKIAITTNLDGNGFLVLTDQYYPGWEARIDGSPAKIYRANSMFMAIIVPSGRHEVVFRYRPASFRLGAVFSAAGLLVLLCLGLRGLHRRMGSFKRRDESALG